MAALWTSSPRIVTPSVFSAGFLNINFTVCIVTFRFIMCLTLIRGVRGSAIDMEVDVLIYLLKLVARFSMC